MRSNLLEVGPTLRRGTQYKTRYDFFLDIYRQFVQKNISRILRTIASRQPSLQYIYRPIGYNAR